jgi:hypothetical protein
MPKEGDRIGVKGTSGDYLLAVLFDGSDKPMDDRHTFLYQQADPALSFVRQMRAAAAMLLMLCPNDQPNGPIWRVGPVHSVISEGDWWVFPIKST